MFPMQKPEPGQTFSSYRDVCRWLNEPVLGGNAKKAQLARWSQHFTWLREGNKWTIVDHEDQQDIAPLTRGSRWSKYIDPQILLTLYAAFHDFGHPAYTKTTLPLKGILLFSLEGLVQLGFCNRNYEQLRGGSLVGIDEDLQRDYFDTSFPRIYTYMVRAFERLSANGAIVYSKPYLIKVGETTRLADRAEADDIDALKATLLRKYDMTEAGVMRSVLRTKFYADLELLVQVQLGFSKLYRVHHLLFTDDSIADLQSISKVMERRKALHKNLNGESVTFHLNLLNTPPFKQITNLVIPTAE
jgi:hypothetical protein